MITVVMMTLGRWDNRGGAMNQVEADQDVADEVSKAGYNRNRLVHKK